MQRKEKVMIKEDEEGVAVMRRAMEEMRDEAARKATRKRNSQQLGH